MSFHAFQQQALLYNAAAEVGAGFLVVLSLLAPPRNIFLVFIYWQFLRMRYWSPDAANYHRMVRVPGWHDVYMLLGFADAYSTL